MKIGIKAYPEERPLRTGRLTLPMALLYDPREAEGGGRGPVFQIPTLLETNPNVGSKSANLIPHSGTSVPAGRTSER